MNHNQRLLLEIIRLWVDYKRAKYNNHTKNYATKTQPPVNEKYRKENTQNTEKHTGKLKDPINWFTGILAITAIFQLIFFVITERGILILKGIDISIEDNGNTIVNNDFANGGKMQFTVKS